MMERYVDKSVCVILEWKQVPGCLWSSDLLQMHRPEEDNTEGLQLRGLLGSTDPVFAFEHFRD